MKKLTTLLFALLFTAGIAFGQNSATTNQNGNNNTIGDHGVGIVQVGGNNMATVTQNGNNNDLQRLGQSFVSSSAANGKNVADISQVGNNNHVKNNGNYDGAIQSGASNLFNVDQAGNGNVVENIHQGTADNISTNGVMNIVQGKNSGGTYNYPNYNYVVHANQFGNANVLNVNQAEENIAYIQAQVSTGQTGNTININQLGIEGRVGHKDNGHGGGGYGIYQNGTNNSMDITQANNSKAGNNGSVSDAFSAYNGYDAGGHGGQSLVQLGNGNSLTATQGDNAVIGPVLQNGSTNIGTITQGAGATVGGLAQVGNANTATIDQSAGQNNAAVTQFGNGNTSTITQQ